MNRLPIEEAMAKAEQFEGEIARAFRELDEAWRNFCTEFWSVQPWLFIWSLAERLTILLFRLIGPKD